MAQEHSHDHAYLHEHNIPHLHHEADVHDADHNHEHAHSHDHAEGHGHVHENTQAVLNRLSRASVSISVVLPPLPMIAVTPRRISSAFASSTLPPHFWS